MQQGTPQEDENKTIYDNTELSELVEKSLMPLSIALQPAPQEPPNAFIDDTSYGSPSLPQPNTPTVETPTNVGSPSLTFIMEKIVIEEKAPETASPTEPQLKEVRSRGRHLGPETKYQSFFVLKK